MDYIAELRKHDGATGDDYTRSEEFDKIESLLYRAKAVEVDSTFEEGGRWSNYKTHVYKVNTITDCAFFTIWHRVPATELQDDDEFEWEFYEVRAVRTMTTVYL